jgi:catechol 2,3-dioxygenase
MDDQPLPPDVRVGHVHLRVSDLDRATAFYRDALGFRVTADARAAGVPAVFLAAGDYHHHIGLNTFESAGAAPPPAGHTGLYHFALVYPDRPALAAAARRVLGAGHAIRGAVDHGGTVSLYLSDPDGNGVELYYDRPRERWYDAQGRPVLKAERFELEALLAPPDAATAVA